MTKTVVIHQPDFIPWLGFFDRLVHADLYIALDHVQFVSGTSRSWTHRDRIKTPHGAQWLTVSVEKAPLGTPIRAMRVARNGWPARSLALLRQNYAHAPHFEDLFPRLQGLLAEPPDSLVDLNLASIDLLADLLDARRPRILSSDLDPQGTSNAMLVDLLQKCGATRYLSGVGARAYFDPAPFDAAGIEVVWQAFEHPVYPQLHGPFIPFLSAIDVLLNCGVVQSRAILRTTIRA